MQKLLMILVIIAIGCSNPVSDEIGHMTGTLGEPAGLAAVGSMTLVAFWELEIPSPHILEVIVESYYGEWIPVDWSLNIEMDILFVYKVYDIDNDSRYRIEYRK